MTGFARTPLPPLKSQRLLDQVRERVRYLHYSLSTERAYVHWIRAYVRHHGMRHPKEMGAVEVEVFLSWLAADRCVAVSTHRQALSALLFLYQQVFGLRLPWMDDIARPQRKPRLPVVLSIAEVSSVLSLLQGEHRVLAQLLYGTGMRISEALQLRVKDVDFEFRTVTVRCSKGAKDRAVMLPATLVPVLREQLQRARARACSAVTICSIKPCSGPSSVRWSARASRGRPRRTHCVIRLPRICCKRAMTSARCKHCWATAMSAPR